MDRLTIIKIGGHVIDDEVALSSFLAAFAQTGGKKLLVHGGGKMATRLAEQLQLPQQMINGRRVTDAETLKIITMVYAGFINKNIVAQLQARQCNAVGLSGADGNAVQAHKRSGGTVDYGFAGDVDRINAPFLNLLLTEGYTPVVAPVTHDKNGQLLNTNADTIAQEIAQAASAFFEVTLLYAFEKEGVLLDVNDQGTVIKKLDAPRYAELKKKGIIFAGMIPKLDNAFAALQKGVKRIVIGRAEDMHQLILGEKGTTITHD